MTHHQHQQFRLLFPLMVALALVGAALTLHTPRTAGAPETFEAAPTELPMQRVAFPTATCRGYVPGDLIGEANPASIDPGC
jgi:hypothetical protein